MQIIIIIIIFIILYLIRNYFIGTFNTIKKDLTNKFIIITGGTSGIGKFCITELLNQNCKKIVFASRSEEKAKEIIQKVDKNLQKKLEFIKLDLCDFSNIKNFATKIKATYPKIDILMNNAGALISSFSLTKNGYDTNLQGNLLGTAYLTFLLLNHFSHEGRIINISSVAHNFSNIELGDSKKFKDKNYLKSHYENTAYINIFKMIKQYINTLIWYGTAKLLLIYLTLYLKDIVEEKYKNIKVFAVHPGLVDTKFYENKDFPFIQTIMQVILSPVYTIIMKTPSQGAQTQLYLCNEDIEKLNNGGYYAECKLKDISKKAKDENFKKEYTNWIIEQIKEIDKRNEIIKELKFI